MDIQRKTVGSVTVLSFTGEFDAMDLRAFGVGPRTWLAQLHARGRDYVLIACGVLLFLVSLGLSLFGYGQFWVPAWALAWAAG